MEELEEEKEKGIAAPFFVVEEQPIVSVTNVDKRTLIYVLE